jgi:hypothetical protein
VKNTINYELKKTLDLIAETDVAVFGGGPSGICAAVAAAKEGARTILIERYGCLGGMASVGEVHPFMPNHLQGECLDRPLYTAWINAMRKYTENDTVDGNLSHGKSSFFISKDLAMLGAEDMCLEAGVKILYHHNVLDSVVNERNIKHVILNSKSGMTAIQAKICIDCTGDADLAALSGCEFMYGNENGYCQPMTLCFKMSGVIRDKMPSNMEINNIFRAAKAAGELSCPRENILWFNWMENEIIHFNATRVLKKSAVNGVSISEAEIEGRKQLREFISFFREHIPGFENSKLYSVAHQIGVRESRRICGIAFADIKTFEQSLKYQDAIARGRYPIDIHHPEGNGTTYGYQDDDEWYEIPYGCIVPKDINNLLIGGRPISVDHALHSSMRVMPIACSIGQAAGIASAMCLKNNCSPHELDGIKLRKRLIEFGANL